MSEIEALFRVLTDDGPRLARGFVSSGPAELLHAGVRLGDLLANDADLELEQYLSGEAPEPAIRVLAPVDDQEIWAAGVTYSRSRDARVHESRHSVVYDDVYEAERPELFLKALPGDARGPDETIGIRADSAWNVPEAELAVVVNAAGRIVGVTLGNDVSSRSIEGENPLYLPQAKLYDKSLSIGPCIALISEADWIATLELTLVVQQANATMTDSIRLTELKRSPEDLVRWLFLARAMPRGAVLLTGTGMIPDDSFTLRDGDRVTISAPQLGALTNTVVEVGAATPSSS